MTPLSDQVYQGRRDFSDDLLPFAHHYNPFLIRNHSRILTIHKARILRKKLLEKTFLDLKKWVKSVQTAGYNGTHTVYDFLHIKASQKVKLLSYETQTTRWQDLHGFQQDLAYTRQETLVSCLTKLENLSLQRMHRNVTGAYH